MAYNSHSFYHINVLAGTTAGATGAGMAEDVSEIITNIAPLETPLWSGMPKTKAYSPNHEWLKDTLAAATSNAAIEGAALSSATLGGRTRYLNYCQIIRKDYEVTDTVEASSQIGIKSEMAYQKTRKMKELARDTEWNLFQSTSSSGASGTARKMIGVRSACLSLGGNYSTSGADRALTTTLFNGVWQSAWTDGADLDKVFCGAARKADLAALVTTAYGQRFITAPMGGKKVIQTIDVYEGDLGVIRVILCRHTTTDSYILLDTSYWKAAVLRPAQNIPIGKQGDSTSAFVRHELTLEYGDPAAGGLLEDIS